jgi:nucleoside-triphosphatase THEP1
MKVAHKNLSETWVKASILGTIWAAFEIVLGSFLHNLKVPFSGNILTAIAIIILISVSLVWTEKGLFWRAGLICALLKTMSPSAVIFGPMIAIFSESLLLEGSVRLFGRNYAGYIVGAMLAMSWNLFHKIANYVIFYGFGIVGIYEKLIKYAQKQLDIHTDLFWTPLLILLMVYALFGLFAAIVGISAGQRFIKQQGSIQSVTPDRLFPENQQKTNGNFNYSITWLVMDIIFIIASLMLLNFTPWPYWSGFIAGIVVLWGFRYKRAMRQLSRPKLWIFFVVLTMLTTLVFTRIQDDAIPISQAMLIGFQMNFRAIVIIIGFAVLGTELYNPVIRDFFMKTYFRKLPLALELSFSSLPLIIARIPDVRGLWRNPVSVVFQVILLAEHRLTEMKSSKFVPKIFILTGERGEGKTNSLGNLLRFFENKKVMTSGIISPRILDNNETTGYDIINIATKQREAFLRLTENISSATIGRYRMTEKGFEFGFHALNVANIKDNSIVIIDEVGKLELNDLGWSQNLQELIAARQNHLLLVVRKPFVESVIKKWNLNPYFVYDISEFECHEIENQIIGEMEK